jgi:hypothetical protein
LEQQDIYGFFEKQGHTYGPLYQRLLWVRTDENQAFGAISNVVLDDYPWNPTVLEAIFQLGMMPQSLTPLFSETHVLAPVHGGSVHFYQPARDSLLYGLCHVHTVSTDHMHSVCHMDLLTGTGTVCFSIRDMLLKRVPRQSIGALGSLSNFSSDLTESPVFKVYNLQGFSR